MPLSRGETGFDQCLKSREIATVLMSHCFGTLITDVDRLFRSHLRQFLYYEQDEPSIVLMNFGGFNANWDCGLDFIKVKRSS